MKVALITALTITVLAVAVQADPGSTAESVRTTQAKSKPKLDPKQATKIGEVIVATWTCQSQRGVPRTPVSAALAGRVSAGSSLHQALPKSRAYRAWVLNLWNERRASCIKALHAHDDVIRRLQKGLAGSPMAGSERDLESAGRRYGISPYFIAAIAATESSLGVAACSSNRYNAFGLSSCGSGWSVPDFQSWKEAYLFMGAFLTGNTRVTSGWPNARTTYDYHGYAACSSCWGSKTAYHMGRLFGVGNGVRYS